MSHAFRFSLWFVVWTSLPLVSEASDRCDMLRPLPDFGRLISARDVRQHWIRNLPTVTAPSPLSSGYNHEMPHYREALRLRNCLVDDINRGALDGRAEMEATVHNIRYYEDRKSFDKADELRLRLARLRAIEQGDVQGLESLAFLEMVSSGQVGVAQAASQPDTTGSLMELVVMQQKRIAELEADLDSLKNRLIRLEILAGTPAPPSGEN